jgi:hypothetical protein
MYVIRRVYEVKPGAARRVATLVKQQGDVYHESGQRSEARVFFNGGTLPGESNRVYMEWTADIIDSPYREGNVIPKETSAFGSQIRELVEKQWIEFYELMVPAKMQHE